MYESLNIKLNIYLNNKNTENNNGHKYLRTIIRQKNKILDKKQDVKEVINIHNAKNLLKKQIKEYTKIYNFTTENKLFELKRRKLYRSITNLKYFKFVPQLPKSKILGQICGK